MLRNMMIAKIHQATVTEANLHYVGSVTIDEAIMEKVNMLPNERVQIVNNHNGERFETYVIPGKRDSGVICLNGAAARLVQPGDTVIIMAYAYMDEEEAYSFKPRIAWLDENNQIRKMLQVEKAQSIER